MLRLLSRSMLRRPLPAGAAAELLRPSVLGSRAASSSSSAAATAAPHLLLVAAAPLPSPLLAVAAAHGLMLQPPGVGAIMRRVAGALLPPITAAFTIASDLMPAIVLTGKKKHHGKNKRYPKAANHGARPCSHIARKQRAAAAGKFKYNPTR